MKWTMESWWAKFERQKSWHKVFAWTPLLMYAKNGRDHYAWLCWVERRREDSRSPWEYR